MVFLSKLCVERTGQNERTSVEMENHVGHIYCGANGCAGVVITDREYPRRVALSLAAKILDEFVTGFPPSTWTRLPLEFPALSNYLVKYQNPQEADSLIRVQKDLDETKDVLVRNMTEPFACCACSYPERLTLYIATT